MSERYVGLRARFVGEVCPKCGGRNPGVGMWLDLVLREWICTRCQRSEVAKEQKDKGMMPPGEGAGLQ